MALTLDARALLAPAQAEADSLARAQQAVEQAAQALKAGALVGLPTETVYGLAADADQPQAVGRIFDAKGRRARAVAATRPSPPEATRGL